MPLNSPSVIPDQIEWLELTLHYQCNNRCIGCFAVNDSGEAMTTEEAIRLLYHARHHGATKLWLGGGEPTLRKDLFQIVARAKLIGYEQIRLETNGMMLAYPKFAAACAKAGITEVAFSIKGPDAKTHDRLTKTEGCFDLMVRGIAEARQRGLTCGGHVLVYRSNLGRIEETVIRFANQDFRWFDLWLFSSVEVEVHENLDSEVLSFDEAVPVLSQARRLLAKSLQEQFVAHVPACVLPADDCGWHFDAAAMNLLVANPGGFTFMLEESPILGGDYVEACRYCGMRSRCNGPRADYLRIHGDSEFQPVPTEGQSLRD